MPLDRGPRISPAREVSYQAGDFSPQAAWAVPFHWKERIAELRSPKQKGNRQFALTVQAAVGNRALNVLT